MKTYYDILEVSRYASDDVIKRAHKVLIKKYHPDLQPPDKKKEAEAHIKKINEAYAVLTDPVKKEKYDRIAFKDEDVKRKEKKTINQQTNKTGLDDEGYVKYDKQAEVQREVDLANEKLQQEVDKRVYEAQERINQQEYKIKKQMQDQYIKRLRNMGYDVKIERPFSWREFITKVLIFLSLAIILIAIYKIPFINNKLLEIEAQNDGIRIISGIFRKISDILVLILTGGLVKSN